MLVTLGHSKHIQFLIVSPNFFCISLHLLCVILYSIVDLCFKVGETLFYQVEYWLLFCKAMIFESFAANLKLRHSVIHQFCLRFQVVDSVYLILFNRIKVALSDFVLSLYSKIVKSVLLKPGEVQFQLCYKRSIRSYHVFQPLDRILIFLSQVLYVEKHIVHISRKHVGDSLVCYVPLVVLYE